MAKIAATRPTAGAPDIGAWLARAWPATRTAAVPAGIVLLALLLRVINMRLQAWTPDTYEQMTAAHRLVAGQFPISTFYPPGVAITLAPAFVFFPQTLVTQQAVIIASALVLVTTAYVALRHATPDRTAPAIAALLIAVMPQFVYFSRDGFFDVTNAAWITGAILIVPWLRGRSLPVFVVYGALLAVAITIRASNPAFLPALIIYWTDAGRSGFSPRRIWRAVLRRELVAAAATMLLAMLLLGYIGGTLAHATARAPFTFDHAGSNVAFYAIAEFGGPLGVVPLAVLAALGASYVWSHNRTLLYVCLYMITVFPLAHVPLPFANNRYMLPSLGFVLLLAAHAPAAVMGMTVRQQPSARLGWRALAVVPVLLLATYITVADAAMLVTWSPNAALSDEEGYRQLRPTIAELAPNSLVVSGGTRGVRDSNSRIEYVDLIDQSLAASNDQPHVDAIMARIANALEAGRPVYYLYTSVEGINITFSTDGPGYQPYFDAASSRFVLTDVFDTDLKFFKLYRIETRR